MDRGEIRLMDDCARFLDPDCWKKYDRAKREGCQIGAILQNEIKASRDKSTAIIAVIVRVLLDRGWKRP